MNSELQQKLSLFAANAQAMKAAFRWRKSLTKRLAALLYAFEAKPADCQAIRECLTIIKNSTGVFSKFQGNMALSIATMLSLKDQRETLFTQAVSVYGMLKDAKFRASDYLVVAAYEIAANTSPDKYENVISRARAFYEGMRANSFFRTGEDDYIFAAMLGLSDIEVKEGVERIDQLYKQLRPDFWPGNSVQTLAQILVLSGEPKLVVERLYSLRSELKARKLRLDRRFTLSSLGILALLPANIYTIAQDIEDARAFLRTQKGFGIFCISKQELLLLAAAMVASAYAKDLSTDALRASISTNIAGIIIAQQAAMVAAVAASGAAASSGSSR